MKNYNPKKIEEKWQGIWAENPELYAAAENSALPSGISRQGEMPRSGIPQGKPKKYVLDMWPYPSGDGLHVGHVESYTATDIMSRYYRMNGFDVIHPQGWDAFGLPAENFAIKTGVHPAETTAKAIATFKSQMNKMGFSYDWSREQNSSSPEYYKWTQWFFLLLYKNGLAYKKRGKVNWCPKCQTVLANEQAEGGTCERCETEVAQKELEQWYFKITDFIEDSVAVRPLQGSGLTATTSGLISGLEKVDWPESIKAAQRNWIGKSEGTIIKFNVIARSEATKQSLVGADNPEIATLRRGGSARNDSVDVFTTRVDTIFGCTYLVVAPEHPILQNKELGITNYEEIEKYIKESQNKTDLERMEMKDKTGVELKGIKVINPFNNEAVPVYVADYVLGHYGTGAVMAVPAHDERDWEFAKKYNLPIKQVVAPHNIDAANPPREGQEDTIRRVVHVIVENAKGEVLTLHLKGEEWGDNKPKTLIIGGIENGESAESTAIREIKEETGYVDVEFIKICPIEFHAEFFAAHKKVNRYVKTTGVVCRLKSEKRVAISEEEDRLHDIVWVKRESLAEAVTIPDDIFLLKSYAENIDTYIDDGVLINSGQYDGLDSQKARKEMTKWLEKNNLGSKKVNYKIRDWLVSRQRYWGAPIPIIYCDRCAADKIKFKFNINFRKNDVWERIIDGKKTVETRALNPEEKERYFGDVMIGDKLLFSNKNNGERRIFEVSEVFKLNLKELFENKELLKSVYGHDELPKSLDELERDYAGTADDYLEKVNKNGLIAWRIKKVSLEIPVPEKDLPVVLPTDVDFKPTGESPLVYSKTFHDVACPHCGGSARRESDTMDTFVCSSWYYFRYADPKNGKEFASKEKIQKWLPVDLYVGGAEHAVLHLLYSRFFTKVLHNLGMIDFDEPFLKLRNQGLILAEDGRKMSKSLGNVVNPDQVVEEFGADSLRMFEMFMGPLEDAKPWNTNGIIGIKRFLEKVWKLNTRVIASEAKQSRDNTDRELKDGIAAVVPSNSGLSRNDRILTLLNKTIKKVTEDIENFRFNTAISTMMILVNELDKQKEVSVIHYSLFLILLSPFAPHIAEELWEKLGHEKSIFLQFWPKYDENLIKDETIKLVIQVNGKVRDMAEASADISEDEAKALAMRSEKIKSFIAGKEIKKVIFVKGRLVNIVVG